MSDRVLKDLSLLRHDFPILQQTMHGKPLIYFDTAATAQKPQCVIDRMNDFYQNHYGTVHRAVYELATKSTNDYQDIRGKVARFLNASKPEEIIFTRGTTESINLVASSFGKAFVKPGDEIIVSELEHHSNIVPWQILCEDRQAILKVIPLQDNGTLDLDAYKKLLSPKTKLVAVGHVANSIGTINPIKTIIDMAHSVGAKVLIDGAQSAPHIPVDVQALDTDFFVFSGHKLYGPTGIGILYGKAALLEEMPPYQGGGDMIEKVTFEKTTYNVVPLKFEAGTPMIAEVMGLGAAIDYINSIGLNTIQEWEHHLLTYATEHMSEIPGLRIIGNPPEKSAIISFVVDKIHPLDLGTLLDTHGVAVRTGHHCAQPTLKHYHLPATTRASFGLYNTIEEIDHFVKAIQDSIKVLT